MIINQIVKENVSLIIPHKDQHENLNILIKNIKYWTVKPDEIIVVDSSEKKFEINFVDLTYLNQHLIVYKIIYTEFAYPGKARNLGIEHSSYNNLAFLDCSTIPTSRWLEVSLNILELEKDAFGVWGSTYYKTTNRISNLIKYSTYGEKNLRTVPGTIVRRELIKRVGYFIDSIRGGEDADWIMRVNIHKLKMYNINEKLTYNDLDDVVFLKLIKKWFRNYFDAANLPYIQHHKNIYFFFVFFLIIFFAFNWNSLVARWDQKDFYYIPNITKVIFIGYFLLYFVYRGLCLPYKKGISFFHLFPFNFIVIFFISFLLDLIKVLAFILSLVKN